MEGEKGKNGKEVRHLTRFMEGRMTPEEAHRAYGIRKSCYVCGKPAAIRIRVLVQLEEITKRNPEFVAHVAATNPEGPYIPTVPTRYGPMVKMSDVGACDNCKVEAERAAARGPSWAIVEIDRGPGADKTQVQVPKGEP